MVGATYYFANAYPFAKVVELVFLCLSALANLVASFHTVTGLISQRGVCTPKVTFTPLSFIKLTRQAIRENLSTIRYYVEQIRIYDPSKEDVENLGLFAAHMNRFRILHEEFTKHEDEVLFRAFSDFFPRHPRKYREANLQHRIKLQSWCDLTNKILDTTQRRSKREQASQQLRSEIVPFFTLLEQHLKGEDENLEPIGNKYVSIELSKQLAREIWRMTPAEKWETILPFVVLNLPRQEERLVYLKALCWSMPARAQQIGAIIYRNVDDVMWERLRFEIPEMIPRGARNWRRYY
jgi:hypothetical protein